MSVGGLGCFFLFCFLHLVYKLLHPLHGVVCLQEWSHSHEAFITVPLILLLLLRFLFFSSSVILFAYPFLVVALWDALQRNTHTHLVEEDQLFSDTFTMNLLWLHATQFKHVGAIIDLSLCNPPLTCKLHST